MEKLVTVTVWPTVHKESSASTYQELVSEWLITQLGLVWVTNHLFGCREFRCNTLPELRFLNTIFAQDNQIIYGKCGGYCGTCEPEHYKGLKLDVMPNNV